MPTARRLVLSFFAWISALARSLRHLGPRPALVVASAALGTAAGCSHKRAAKPAPPHASPSYAGTRADPGYSSPSRVDGGYAESGHRGMAESADSESSLGTTADASGRRHSAHSPRDRRGHDDAYQPAPTPRPGLGTAYGEHHRSSVVNTSFTRGAGSPDVVLSLWYNDHAGVDAMARSHGRRTNTNSASSTADGAFVVEIVDEHGRTLPATDVDGRRYAAGHAGARYKLRIRNNSAHRFEVVASVDGLDVIDGGDAAFHKRGYILDGWTSITIDGWRTSDDSVAAFRFSAVADSYAERTGRGRNVGVVGVAFFHERGAASWDALEQRHRSEPFPGQYAPPPPPRWR